MARGSKRGRVTRCRVTEARFRSHHPRSAPTFWVRAEKRDMTTAPMSREEHAVFSEAARICNANRSLPAVEMETLKSLVLFEEAASLGLPDEAIANFSVLVTINPLAAIATVAGLYWQNSPRLQREFMSAENYRA